MLRSIVTTYIWIILGVIIGASLALGWMICYLAATLRLPGHIASGNLRRNICFVHIETFLGGSIDRFANVSMLIPAGAMIVLTRGRCRLAWIIATLTVPLLAEFLQWLIPHLGRTCHLMDVVDNYTGAVAGLAIGAVTLSTWR